MTTENETVDAFVSVGFDNPAIRNYFEGTGDYVPEAETAYALDHPLVTPNFIGEIEVFLNLTLDSIIGTPLENVNASSALSDRLNLVVQKFSTAMETDGGSPKTSSVLPFLKELYAVCKEITGLSLPLVK